MKTASPTIRLDLSVLVYAEGEWWIAHCLEFDLAAEGRSPTDAFKNLIDVTNHQIRSAMDEADLSSLFMPAPAELWKLFSISQDYEIDRIPRKPVKSVNRFHVRQLQLA